MSDRSIWLLILFGLFIIAGLSLYIVRKTKVLKEYKSQALEKKNSQTEQKKYLVDSLKVLAITILDDQVELSEGCIRIKVILDHLAPLLHEDESFKIFELMYVSTQHMPTHDARKKVDKHFIDKLDTQRFALEEKHREEIKSASRALLDYLEAEPLNIH